LRDAGNGVGIVFEQGSGRIPDIWLEPSLIEQEARKPHLAAVLVSGLGYTVEPSGQGQSPERIEITPSLHNRLVRHPGYRGDLNIHEGQPPWQSVSSH
jgi:hypothetical protein